MDIKHIFDDPCIVKLENDIARIIDHCRYTDEENNIMKRLLKQRSDALWQLNVYDDEMKQLLIGFNDALRKACTELYHRTMAAYQECLHRDDFNGNFEVEGMYSLVTNILHNIPFRPKRQSRCGKFSPVKDSVHSMIRVALGHSVSVKSGLLKLGAMRHWRNGWAWKTRTTTGMRVWTENGQKIYIL